MGRKIQMVIVQKLLVVVLSEVTRGTCQTPVLHADWLFGGLRFIGVDVSLTLQECHHTGGLRTVQFGDGICTDWVGVAGQLPSRK